MAGSDNEVDLSREVGEVIRAWRQARALTGEQLAKLSGTNKAYISLLETGRIQRPGKDRLVAIATALDISVAALLTLKKPGEIVDSGAGNAREDSGLAFPQFAEVESNSPLDDVVRTIWEFLSSIDTTDERTVEIDLLSSYVDWRLHCRGAK